MIFVLYSFDTGHPTFAFWTAVSKASFVAPGTLAFRSRWLSVMANPSGCFSRLIAQEVSMLSAVRPACASCAESAIEKQPACAAARSSSGFVPFPSSKRVWNE